MAAMLGLQKLKFLNNPNGLARQFGCLSADNRVSLQVLR
jgi:hypothetical protein